ncbi:helix-turn-helix domain-containing protein [Lawsonibacter sp. OA9]|uniref:helix-turn-helix domain-containing protein n=1 Tax=Lawsonibacter sp. OA9 TaxID=2914163 RepID=UPI001F07071B|nr:helix-turn-helix transcriptional regulator [Lawsonibacter sp. OA9]MCH1979496.1 helix-turn-helix domain-containing protein [Lawsonibacter sp. OA9]
MEMLGENIRHLRKVRGMTQEELAKKAGLSTMSIRRYENGERIVTEKAMAQIATALDVDIYEFFPEDEKIDNDRFPWWPLRPPRKLSDAEAHRMGFLKFNSEEDRIAHFYSLLNTDGKLVAGKCFYQHLDKECSREVADYVEKLSEIPQYQYTDAPQPPTTPTDGKDTPPLESPLEEPPEGK